MVDEKGHLYFSLARCFFHITCKSRHHSLRHLGMMLKVLSNPERFAIYMLKTSHLRVSADPYRKKSDVDDLQVVQEKNSLCFCVN